MVASNTCIVCPKCKAVNCYEIINSEYIDTDLHTTYSCDACGSEYTNIYALVYLGGYANSIQYDRDNITVK